MKWQCAAIFAPTLMLAAGNVEAQARLETDIDRAAISKLSAQFGIKSKVIKNLDLTQPFQTKSQWSLVVAKQPDEESSVMDGAGSRIRAVALCFVKNVVFSAPQRTLPPAEDKELHQSRGTNGNCEVSTFLFAYDRKAERFRVVFFNMMGRNNNEEARFIEDGPLLGCVVVAYPTDGPPFTYFVEVYKRNSGSEYSQVLRYRGHTGYDDGNPLAVIDSEMPDTLRRLGLWKTGDALPVPPRMPGGCKRLVLRKGIEWCEAH